MEKFKIKAECGKARWGVLRTAHREIETPFFMPVATKGSVKLLSNEEVESAGTECMISNGFVLFLKPGLEVIGKQGGLHKFMGWERGLFTDSGGFQVLSKDFCIALTEEGVRFRNPFDGKDMVFTPEKAIEIQSSFGSDVAMCLDDVPLHRCSVQRLEEAAKRTTEWAKRCKEAHTNDKQMLFGICQGGTDLKLREKSAREISEIGFDGIALGGLCIGEEKEKMFRAVDAAIKVIPRDKPRYLMGVGSAQELEEAVARGVDVFDSCFPTRTARHGLAFSGEGNLNIAGAKYRNDSAPIDKECDCFVCKGHSRAYIHHLFKTKEENGLKYLSYHNLFYIQRIMERIRTELKDGSFRKGKEN